MATATVRSTLDLESYSLRNMYLSVFVVKMVYLYVGMMLAWTFLLIPFLETKQQLSMSEKVLLLACLPFGMVFGPITGSIFVPRFGFKSVILQFASLSFTSVLLLAFCYTLVVCAARFAAGVAIGAFLCYVDPYLQDISDVEVITLLNPLSLGFLSLGFYVVYDIGQILIYFEMLTILLIVPLVFLVCLIWLPESPYVDVATGNLDGAKRSVDFLHRGISTRGLEQMINLIQDDARRREAEHEIFLPPYSKQPIAARVSLAFFTLLPLTGFPVVFMLMEPLISDAQQQVAVSSSLSAIARVDLCPIAIALIINSYCSSRLRMTASAAVMAVSMTILGIFFFNLERGEDVSGLSWLPLICFVFYTLAFLIGFVHKPSESVTQSRTKSCGRVLTLTCGFISMLLVTLLFPTIKAALGAAPILWIFSAFSVLLSLFSYIYTPETTIF